MADVIAVAGALAQKPGRGGHTWVFLQYLLGFRRLGYDVLFLDQLAPEMCVDARGNPCRFRDSYNLAYFLDTMRGSGLSDSFSLDYNHGEEVVGLPRRIVLERLRRAGAIVNVMGFLRDDEMLATTRNRVFLDIDPGFGQMWQALGLCQMFEGHDHYATIGLNIGRSDCEIPTCGVKWITTPQPVVLELWPQQAAQPAVAFTSVMSWRGAYGTIEYGGKAYGLRVHEFRKVLGLPRQSGRRFEVALDIDSSDAADLARLAENGWTLVDSRDVARDPWRYRSYIQNSWAEICIAKGIYVQSRSGWLSDRSLCYLASGRPVLALDTGLRQTYPSGAGLILFSTMAEAMAAVEELSHDYRKHAAAAVELAQEHFDSDRVLRRLLSKTGVA